MWNGKRVAPFETESIEGVELGWSCGWDDDDEGLMEAAAEVCSVEEFCSQKTSEAPSAVGSLGRRDERRVRTAAVGTR